MTSVHPGIVWDDNAIKHGYLAEIEVPGAPRRRFRCALTIEGERAVERLTDNRQVLEARYLAWSNLPLIVLAGLR
jgi:hypothetical protein